MEGVEKERRPWIDLKREVLVMVNFYCDTLSM